MVQWRWLRSSLLGLLLRLWLDDTTTATTDAFSVVVGSYRKNSAIKTLLDDIYLRRFHRRSGLRLFASAREQDETANEIFKNDGDDDEDYDDDDFGAWITANLKQWPLLPTGKSQLQPGKESTKEKLADEGELDANEMIGAWNVTAAAIEEASFVRSPLSRILNIKTLMKLTMNPASNASTFIRDVTDTDTPSTTNWTSLNDEELSAWDRWMGGLVQSTGKSAEVLVKQALGRMEALVVDASSAVSPATVLALIRKSSETATNVTTNTAFLEAAKQMARDRGLSVSEAADRAWETTAYAASLLRTADGVFRKGYVEGDPVAAKLEKQSFLNDVPVVAGSRALFDAFGSVSEVNIVSNEIVKAAEMGALAGAIYEDTVPRTRALSQTIVAQGTTDDVAWMVTDAIANQTSFAPTTTARSMLDAVDDEPFLVRTITIRGFDASDESVDRELLLNRVCSAAPVPIQSGVLVHSGMLEIARSIYKDIKPYLDWTASTHKIVLNGHSVGGSLSLLLLFLMVKDYGAEFVTRKVVKVYTFGSPPIAVIRGSKADILAALELPTSIVQGFVQPWDPIVRLFSDIDALYPLVSDLGADGITPFANGPPRALRTILKSIIESWVGWPRFRDNFKGTANQTYTSVGVQHLLLPEPARYLADRFVAANIPVPPVETVLRISSKELYPALVTVFPLDVFEISYIPQAIRSFVHHFYPAYGFPLLDYVKELQRQSRGLPERSSEFAFSEEDVAMATEVAGGIDWSKAKQWLIRSEAKP